MDTITNQIVQQINNLPIGKKKALLKLLKSEWSTIAVNGESFYENWKRQLLATSVWTDAEINAIHKAREFINQWTPQQFS
jgi:uncharacterized protein (UPF0216 family)